MVRDGILENEIKSHLKHKCDVLVFESLDSTNKTLKQMAADGADEGTLLIAKSQSKGRGRLGRSFMSKDGGLYLSLLLRPESSAEASLLVTVSAAVSVAKAIEKICDKQCKIKWVNDIFLNSKKVSGILCEGAINPQTAALEYAVLGIGVNIVEPKESFGDELRNIATAIYNDSEKIKILPQLAAEIVNTFMDYYKNLQKKEYMSEYKERSILIGKTVTYVKEDILYTAKVLGIDDNAKLILDQNGEKVFLVAGEVSVRIAK